MRIRKSLRLSITCPRKVENCPRKEVAREVEEEGEKVAKVVVKEVEEVEMMQQARVKLERKRELHQLKVEKWLKAMLVVVDRELGRKRRTRRRTTKIKTKKVEEG